MGREIVVELRDFKSEKIYKDDYVCGRDDATGYIAQLIYNRHETLPELDEDVLTETQLGDRYSLIFDCRNNESMKELDDICSYLQEYADKDHAIIQKVKDRLEDLREARRHCITYEEFQKFSDAMEEAENWLENEDYSRAQSLIDDIKECKDFYLSNYPNNTEDYDYTHMQIRIMLSE